MIVLKNIKARNFLSLGKVEVDLYNRGLTVIDGINNDSQSFDSNGSGKSSILEAITYSLYGKTIRGLSGDDVVNRVKGKEMEVILSLEVDNKSYTVARRRKFSGRNSIELIQGLSDITPSSEANLNVFMEELLGMPFKVFISSIMYNDKSVKFAVSSNSELKAMFDSILQLDYLEDCLETTKTKLKDLESKKANIETKMSSIASQLSTFEELEKEEKIKYKRKLKEFQEAQESILEYIEELRKEKDYVEELLSQAKKSVSFKEADVKTLEKELSNLEAPELTNPKIKYDEELGEIDEVIDQMSHHIKKLRRTLKDFEDEIESETKRVKRYERALEEGMKVGDRCTVCNSIITEENLSWTNHETILSLSNSRGKIHGAKLRISPIEKDIEDLEEKLKKLRKKQFEVQEKRDKELEQYKIDLENLKNSEYSIKAKELEAERKELVNLTKNLAELDKKSEVLKAKIKGKRSEYERYSERPVEDDSERYSVKITECKEQLEVGKTNIENLVKDIKALTFWKEAFGLNGIKSALLENIIPFLNTQVNKYLSNLSEGTVVEFSNSKLLKSGKLSEGFTIDVFVGERKVDYFSASGGERKRIDIAIVLAIQDLLAVRSSKGINIVFMDEVFDALDITGAENVVSLLADMNKSKGSIFLITHNNDFKTYFSNILTVVKKDGVSYIQ